MKKTDLLLLLVLNLMHGFAQTPRMVKQEVDYVRPVIGTPFAGFAKGLEGGGTLPSVGTPYGMTNFLAQTAENKMGRNAYMYEDSSMIGFLASHQPTVWMGDYGYVSVMPGAGGLKLLPDDRRLAFNHKTEISTPYYYSVLLNGLHKQTIKAEIAAASRCGLFRFTFPATEHAHIVIQGINLNPALKDWANEYDDRIKNLKGYIKIDTLNREVTGYNPDRTSAQLGPDLPNFKGYFVIRINKAIKSFGTWDEGQVAASSTEQLGTRMGAYIGFDTHAGEQVILSVATSFISLEQARENMKKEIPGWDFERLVAATRNTWQQNLSRIKVQGATEDQKTIFYTELFHTMQFPREMSEYGRYYSGFDDKVHTGISYTDFSLWDTYRALHPLLLFTQPERVDGMINAMLQMYQQGGRLPIWPNPAETNIMISSHADAVIADAYVKGFRGYDPNLAYEALLKDAIVPPEGDTLYRFGDRDKWTSYEARAGLTYYKELGYVPVDKTAESVSRTIEYAADDYCVAQLAKALGKTEDYERFMLSAKNYKNLYDTGYGFLLPRRSDGRFDVKNKTGGWEGFTEGDQWTYTFGAMQDIPGMIEMMGGKDKFTQKLDENFSRNHYRHDNEPGHHYIYLYDYCGQPWKTQELVRKHTSENFRNSPLGINGNEDCGQMAAWYIFSVMGFYPVTPASGVYAIGAPQYPEIKMNFTAAGKARSFEIIADNLSVKNLYVQRATLDGKVLNKPFITHEQITNGNKLVFTMGNKPNKHWN